MSPNPLLIWDMVLEEEDITVLDTTTEITGLMKILLNDWMEKESLVTTTESMKS